MASSFQNDRLSDASAAGTNRVWTLQELDILQELPTPVVVLLYEANR